MDSLTVQQLLNQAVLHHQAGRLQLAEQIYRQILLKHPREPDALHMLGLVAWQTGRNEIAIDLIREAIKCNANFPAAFYNLGNALRDNGKLDEAIAAYRRAIELRPGFVKAHNNLGVLLTDLRQPDQAIAAHQRVIAIEPENPDGHYNLGNALLEKGELDAAFAAYQRAILLRPVFADAYYSLGNTLSFKGRLNEAVNAFSIAITQNPGMQKAYTNLSIVLSTLGQTDDALLVCQRAISALPHSSQSYCDLANVLKAKGLLDQAIDAYRNAIDQDAGMVQANNGLAEVLEMKGNLPEAIAVLKAAEERCPGSYSFALAAMGVGDAPPATPNGYIADLFDSYSVSFDQHLQRLNYNGPQLLLDAVRAVAPLQALDIIDLGCGTGLCGPLFRPMARRLVGIDLSPKMIHMARQRGVYDDLREQDITLALQESAGSFDLIISADVMIYVGSLDAVIPAAAGALRPGGLMAFTIETADAGDYVLRKSRRYAHSTGYIERLAAASGFKTVIMQDAVLRIENAHPMEAKVIVLQAMDDRTSRG